MKLQNIHEVEDFRKVIHQCKDDVFLKSQEGDVFNLKSAMSEYIALGRLLSEQGDSLELFADIPFFTGYTLANLPIVLFIYIGVTGIGFTCYFLSMEVTSAQTTSLVFFFKPALAPLLAFLVLHEAIPSNMLGGIACILCGSLVSILPGLLAQRKSALPVTEGATREKIEV